MSHQILPVFLPSDEVARIGEDFFDKEPAEVSPDIVLVGADAPTRHVASIGQGQRHQFGSLHDKHVPMDREIIPQFEEIKFELDPAPESAEWSEWDSIAAIPGFYRGAPSAKVIRKNRAKNKAAKVSRRINRK